MHQKHIPVNKLDSCNLEMTNLCSDEMAFFHRLTKIGTDENKAIYSKQLAFMNFVIFLFNNTLYIKLQSIISTLKQIEIITCYHLCMLW